MPDPAPSLYEALRALEHRAAAARRKAGLSSSRREAAAIACKAPYKVKLNSRLISSWLPPDSARAQIPRADEADKVWALVRVWSEWAGDRIPEQRYWLDLIVAAQPTRARKPVEGVTAVGRWSVRDYSRSRAVVIGTWDYDFLTPVPAARNSLDRMAGLLTGSLCGWPKDRLMILANQRGPGDLSDRLTTAFEDASDIALFYYVGHGQIEVPFQLSLGLVGSRPEAQRRASTSLPFATVRRSLVDSNAAIKIVILDCCFGGSASGSHSTLVAEDIIDLTVGTGACTIVAISTCTTAWYESGRDITRPQTLFTGYLADLIETGVPGEPAGLQLRPLFMHLRDKLVRDGQPIPVAGEFDTACDFVFAYNASPPITHYDRDLEFCDSGLELHHLNERLAGGGARRIGFGANEHNLSKGAAEPLREQKQHGKRSRRIEATAPGTQQKLREASNAAEPGPDETCAAQVIATTAVPAVAKVTARLGDFAGHAFISYVREDSRNVDHLQRTLQAAGIPVWRDTANLWPGEDWRAKIRRAITDNALVFLACFSQTSLSRRKSYYNEELTLAIDQLRLRPPDDPWLIPVRLDECEIPDRDIGGGRTLRSIQRADLFGDRSLEGAERLVAAILRILTRHADSFS
jgi:hypothetical protein